MVSAAKPTHLLAQPDDRRTLCGIDARTNAAMPHLLARFVPAHRAGHAEHGRPFVVCADCEQRADALDSGAYT